MSDVLVVAVNVIAACGSAAFAGVMLSVGVTLGGYWRSLEPAEFLHWFRDNNRFVARSVPIVVAPTFLALVASAWMGRGGDEVWLWLVSLGALVAVLVLTGAYFVPANTAFAAGTIEADAVAPALGTVVWCV